ncbi:MAG: AAA family ATPase [Rhodobacteraceae bacterium]|nr:AAA family ATPase [Paracoccaceae bacterium]
MSKKAVEGSLELEITDFGPIARAKVDLRPLTVFVGPSNTGKSYLAILIYALHRFFGQENDYFYRRLRNAIDPEDPKMKDLSDQSFRNFQEIVDSIEDVSPGDIGNVTLTPASAEALRSFLDKNAEALASEIGRCFGLGETRALTRKGRPHARIAMRRRMSNDSEFGEHTLTLGRKTEFKTAIPSGIPIPFDYETNTFPRRYFLEQYKGTGRRKVTSRQRRILERDIMSIVSSLLMPSAVGILQLPAFYLPADRTGVMHAHNVVVSALIASAPSAGFRPAARTPMLSGVLADFLEQLVGIGLPEPWQRKTQSDLGKRIEESVLKGSIRIDRAATTDYPSFAYRPIGWNDDLALANASSMVSELAPVVLYLRHLVKTGHILIVEEPESHLHPAMQVEFTRQLAALVDRGIHLIVTTHSEWLLEELANIVRRSELNKHKRSDFVSDVALRPEQVGVWLFEPKSRPKGSIVKEIRLDSTGTYPTDYDEVAEALHNDWAEITSQIGNGS